MKCIRPVSYTHLDVYKRQGEWIGKQMQVQAASVGALGVSAVCGSCDSGLCHGTAIDRTAVIFHPVRIYFQSILRAGIQIASGGRAYIHEQVAAAGHGIYQHADEHFRRFPGLLVPCLLYTSRCV